MVLPFFLATMNVLSLATDGRLTLFDQAVMKIKADVIGLCEVRRKEEGAIDLTSSSGTLYHTGRFGNRSAGCGFFVSRRMKPKVVRFLTISPRIALLDCRLPNNVLLRLVQCYAPCSNHSDDQYDAFLSELESVFRQVVPGQRKFRKVYRVIMGDLNARVGKALPGDTAIGKFGYGDRNDRGEKVITLCETLRLRIGNTMFQKQESHCHTWVSPTGTTTTRIDYILYPRDFPALDVDVVNRMDFTSDHRMVRASFSVEGRPLGHRGGGKNEVVLVRDQFKDNLVRSIEGIPVGCDYSTLVSSIQQAATLSSTPAPSVPRFSPRTRQLFAERSKIKATVQGRDRVQWVAINKALRGSLQQDAIDRMTRMVEKAVEEGSNYSKAIGSQSVGRERIVKMQGGKGTVTTQADLEGVFREYYNKLYKGDGGRNYTVRETEEEFIPIGRDEVESVLRGFTSGKSPGEDRVSGEMLKAGAEILSPYLTAIFNKILIEGFIPQGFGDSRTILLFKGGDKTLPKNYRPISLLPVIQKTLTAVINNRIGSSLDNLRAREQQGFRGGHSTVDGIFILNTLIANCREFKRPLYLLFLDVSKAFDSVLCDSVLTAMERDGVHSTFIRFLQSLTVQSKSSVVVNGKGVEVDIGRGVRQGDGLSPRLFVAVLDTVFRGLNWGKKGICINGEYLSHLLYADDCVLISHDPRQIQSMVRELERELLAVGLCLNGAKTVALSTIPNSRPVIVAGETVVVKDKVVYLGQEVTMDSNRFKGEIHRRVRSANWAFSKYSEFFRKRGCPMVLKKRLFDGVVLPAFLYGAETWYLCKRDKQILSVAQRKLERKMLGITVLDHIRNEHLRSITKLKDVVREAEKRKWMWAERLSNFSHERWSLRILEWTPQGRRNRGRPLKRWRDDFVNAAGPQFLQLARDRTQWRTLMATQLRSHQ